MTVRNRRAPSLRLRLVAALSLLVIVVAIVAALWSNYRATVEAKEAQDALLERVSELAVAGAVPVGHAPPESDWPDNAGEENLEVATVGGEGKDSIPTSTPLGLSTIDTPSGPRRVNVQPVGDGPNVAVSQAISVRDDAAQETMVSTLIPLVVVVPILVLTSWLIVSWGLRPLDRLRRELESRDDGSLEPLPAVPVVGEVAGFVMALEALHSRAAEILDGQRRFAAEAAHELRTPIAAISFQAEHLMAAATDDERRNRAAVLRKGLERTQALCEQLLALGVDPTPDDRLVPLGDIARTVAGDVAEAADSGGAEMSWDLGDSEDLLVPEVSTWLVLHNLTLNAIRHAGSGGPIDVTANRVGNYVIVDVADCGPGIAEPERVIEAFHREAEQNVEGSGLGLAITSRTIERLGGTLELLPRGIESGGTVARVALPVRPGRRDHK